MSDLDEWRAALDGLTEQERAGIESECRRALGLCGDREDARYER